MRSNWIAIMALIICTSCVQAQQKPAESLDQTQVPDVQAPAKPAPGEQQGIMSGNKPFSLVSPEGELLYDFDPATKELRSIKARKGAIFSSEDMTINSDDFEFKAKTQQLFATGRKVLIRQGEIIMTCQCLKYDAKTQKSVLTGNPIMYNKQADGKLTTTSGREIIITNVNGSPQVQVKADKRNPAGLHGGNPESTSVPPDNTGNARLGMIGKPADAKKKPSSPNSGSSKPAAPAGAGTIDVSGKLPGITSTPAVAKSSVIDPNNPEDLQSFSKRK